MLFGYELPLLGAGGTTGPEAMTGLLNELFCKGLQVATNTIAEGVGAAKMAADAGCTWLDLNCGCPIYGDALSSDPGIVHKLSGACMSSSLACTI